MTTITTDQRIDVTEALLKYASGQYDVALIRSLSLAHVGLRSLGGTAFQGCSTLTVLDISHNALPTLDGIEWLSDSLRRLDASGNRLTSAAGVGQLPRLEVLNLAGNSIAEPDALLMELAGLPTLRALHLQDRDGGRQNPVCRSIPEYGKTLTTRFATLRCLDGHYFCHESLNPQRIDNDDDDEFVLPPTKPWLPEGFFNTKGFDYGQRVGTAAEKQFAAAAADCRKVLDAA